MHRALRFVTLSICLVLSASNTSCTPEKAKALQTAATSFFSESQSAITTIQDLFSADVGASVELNENEVEDTLRTLQQETSISAKTLSELLTGSRFEVPALEEANKKFTSLQAEYAQFAAMYQSLDRGYLFAGKSVKQSETISVKLTIQMINFADIVKREPFQLRSRRVLLIEKINRAYQLTDEVARTEALRSAALDIVQLREDEASAKDRAVKQCLKAAEVGRMTTTLIRDYNKMSIGDMLYAINNTLSFVSDISNSNNVGNLLKKYKAIKIAIETDPYWRSILSESLTTERANAKR